MFCDEIGWAKYANKLVDLKLRNNKFIGPFRGDSIPSHLHIAPKTIGICMFLDPKFSETASLPIKF